MKKIFFLMSVILCVSVVSCSQSQADKSVTTDLSTEESENLVYELYPTQNMWNFIKLNTCTGQLWLVQFDVQGDNRIEDSLSLISQVPKNEEVNGRFMLYSTQNIWTFIMLDRIDGRTWQVQWSLDPENRAIVRIN